MRNDYVRGKGYDEELRSEDERVSIKFIPANGDERPFVLVRGEIRGRLFLAALDYVSYALAGTSGEVPVMPWDGKGSPPSGATRRPRVRCCFAPPHR